MNIRTRFRFLAGQALMLPIVAAASVAAHPPLPGAPDLPLRISLVGERAAPVPLTAPDRQWNHPLLIVPPPLALPEPGFARPLPNWEVGRNSAMLLPNYEPGTVTFELLDIDAIARVAPGTARGANLCGQTVAGRKS